MSLSLIVPWFGGSPEPIKRTVKSTQGISSEVVIVHQKLFDDDEEVAKSLADKVATVDWNELFKEGGYGLLPNIGASVAASKWMLLLGVGETVAHQYSPILKALQNASNRVIFRADHIGDVHTWGRIWSPEGGTYWSGPIHEEAGNGLGGPVIFRMQDTPKEAHPDPFRNECMRWMKVVTYAVNYHYLLHNPEKLGFTNAGWVNFVNGSRNSIEKSMEDNKDLVEAGMTGDRDAFYAGVRRRIEEEKQPVFVNHSPTGQPISEGALPPPQ